MTIHARRLADSSAPAQKASREKACFSQIVSTGLECDTFAAYAAGGVLFMFTGFRSETLICIHLFSQLISAFISASSGMTRRAPFLVVTMAAAALAKVSICVSSSFV